MKKNNLLNIFIIIFVIIILVFILFSFVNIFYPNKYKKDIESLAQRYNIDPALVASIANVESGFNENAVSSKGAKGIMQIMPRTAEWINKKYNEKYSEEMLFNPLYNIKTGCMYLSYLQENFLNFNLVICAYNAGPNNVKKWLKNNDYSDDGQTLKKIPFKETKKYLENVHKNYYYYKNRYK